jgi:hypothetical protein
VRLPFEAANTTQMLSATIVTVARTEFRLHTFRVGHSHLPVPNDMVVMSITATLHVHTHVYISGHRLEGTSLLGGADHLSYVGLPGNQLLWV